MRIKVLLVALLVALGPGCARHEPTVADVVRGSSLRFLPRDTAGVAVMEVARIEDRAALTRWLGEAAGGLTRGSGLAPLAALIGGDLMKQVDRVAVALIPGGTPAATGAPAGLPADHPAAAAAPPGWAVLVEGRFDPATLKAADGIVPLVEIASGPAICMTALPGGALAIGPRGELESIRAIAGRPQEGFAGAPLMSILAAVSPSGQAWGAIDYTPLADFTTGALRGSGSSLSLPAPRSAGALRGVAFEGHLAAGAGFTVVGVADAEPGAKQLAAGARGLVALARMGASQGQDTAWLGFLDGLRIDQAGAEVRIQGTIAGPMLQALAARLVSPNAAPSTAPAAVPDAGSGPSGAAADATPGTAGAGGAATTAPTAPPP